MIKIEVRKMEIPRLMMQGECIEIAAEVAVAIGAMYNKIRMVNPQAAEKFRAGVMASTMVDAPHMGTFRPARRCDPVRHGAEAEKGGRGMSGLKNGVRFDYTDPALTVIRMAEGNSGAAQAMMQAWRCANGLVPGMDGSAWEMIKICDELEIYGSRLYQLWSDCLGRSQEKMADCAMGYREGRISAAFIRKQIRGDGCRGYRFEPGEVSCGGGGEGAA